jgi:parvulin-like peptidyl-prolyl isomerase
MKSKIFISFLVICAYCIVLAFLIGCASLHQERVLAIVDGDPITEGDLEYSLTVTHRREDLSSAGGLKLSDYIEKLVDDRLIIDEARRSGMDQYPEIKRAVEAFILRESVVRLHDEEIVRKVSVTDNEIKEFYRKNYEQFTLGLIEVTSEEVAAKIVNQLKQGEDFEEIAKTYSVHVSREKGGKVVYRSDAIPTYFMEVIAQLQPGEISDSIHVLNKYFIVKYYGKEEAPWGEEFDKLRGRIGTAIRKQEEKERGEEYLDYLRQKASIKINEGLLAEIQLDGGTGEREKWAEDTRPLVEIDNATLTAGDFVSIARPSTRKTKEDILKSWINRKLVDIEALSRHYEKDPQVKRMVNRYENQLLKDMFIKRVIVPQINITEEMAKEYYTDHQESFTRPDLYNIQQITVKDKDEAQIILENLQKGADFSWWAKKKSISSSAVKGRRNTGWLPKSSLPEPVQEIIDTLNPGDVTPILEVNSHYIIVRLKDKNAREVKQYEKVRDAAYRACFNEKLKTIYNEYVDRLKTDAEIVVYGDEVELLEEKLFK